MASFDAQRRRRGVRVTAGAIGAALTLALGGGVLASGAVAGAATTTPTSSSTGQAPAGTSVPPSEGSARPPVGFPPGGKLRAGFPPGGKSHTGFPPAGKPPAAVGTVKSADTDSFKVSTAKGGTVTVDVNSSTTYMDRSVSSPSLTDVKAEEHVLVFGNSDSGIVKATTVLIGEPPSRSGTAGRPPLPAGTSGGPPKTGTPPKGWSAPAASSSQS